MAEPGRTYYIDSHRKVSGTDSNFTYAINMPKLASADGMAVCVMSAVIPKSYYLVASGRNTFTLTENGVSVTITVTPGNYSASSFKTTLVALLNAATMNGYVYALDFDSRTAKYSYTVTGGGAVSVTLPASQGSGLHEQFGCTSGATYTFPFTSPNVVKFQAKDTLLLHSDIMDTSENDVLVDLIASSNTDFSSITYRCTDVVSYAKKLRTVSSGSFRFYVTDEDGQPIDLNGLNMVISIRIFHPLDYLIRNYIDLRVAQVKDKLKIDDSPKLQQISDLTPAL